MIGLIRVTERGATPGLATKVFRQALKVGWQETGILFHRDFLPKRFTHQGARELNYTPRKGENQKGQKGYFRTYTGRKQKKFGHTLPMVWSGESRALARVRDVRATSKGVRVVLKARKLNFRHPQSQVNLALEIRRVSPTEVPKLTKHHARSMQPEIDRVQETRVTDI